MTEHVVEKDDKYHKIKNGSLWNYRWVSPCRLPPTILYVRLINQVEIKDFVGTSIAE